MNKTILMPLILWAFLTAISTAADSPFSLNLEIKKDGQEYDMTLILRNNNKEYQKLYILNPKQFGKTSMLCKFQDKVVSSETSTTYSPSGFSGFILSGDSEYKFEIKCKSLDDGFLYSEEIDQKLAIFEKDAKVAVKCVLYIANYSKKESDVVFVTSNFAPLSFDKPTAKFPPPKTELDDFSNLPPPD